MTLILDKHDIESILSMKETIKIIEEAFKQFALKNVVMPLRICVNIKQYNGSLLSMPAYIGGSMDSLGLKVVTVYKQNPIKYGLPTILATIQLHDSKTGKLLALMDGTYITAMRTGAVVGVATKYLANKDSKTLGVFGAGTQGKYCILAVKEVRNIELIKVYDLIPSQMKIFCEEIYKKTGIKAIPVNNPKETVYESDIIITATTSKNPVFNGELLEKGVHINAIGAHTPDTRELDEITIKKSKIIVDSKEATLNEAGDLIIPIKKGLISSKAIYAELGEVITGKKPGRESKDEITVFKSVGLAIQDISTAKLVYEKAIKENIGKTIEI
ncbi:MAG: ornithine cyclodeaminase family protein [Candidatus Bathyarchaeia archaeon]